MTDDHPDRHVDHERLAAEHPEVETTRIDLSGGHDRDAHNGYGGLTRNRGVNDPPPKTYRRRGGVNGQ